jgi:Rrf2 family protein
MENAVVAKIVNLSESSLIAMHSLALIAKQAPQPLSVKEIAAELEASQNTAAKVMQRLVKAGFVQSIRGPSGGFILTRDPGRINLLQIYQAIEGELDGDSCPFNKKDCVFGECLFGTFMNDISKEFAAMFSKRTLSDYI